MICSKKNILLILTGGTICSFANERGERDSDTKRAQYLILEKLHERDRTLLECVNFDVCRPTDTLSENISVSHWNDIIDALKCADLSKYDGAILLHGTDTLAYTSALLSVLLEGTPTPVFLVASQLPVYMEGANGVENLRAAISLIQGGIAPNVYAVYKNQAEREGEREGLYLHLAAHLRQCAEGSNNFYSKDMKFLDPHRICAEGVPTAKRDMPLYKAPKLSAGVLFITPYAAIDYSHFSLRGVRAVLHGAYHSQTLSARGYKTNSVLSLIKRCRAKKSPIPLFIAPCCEDSYDYESTGSALREGAIAICGATTETSYARLLIGTSAGFSGDDLVSYVLGERDL